MQLKLDSKVLLDIAPAIVSLIEDEFNKHGATESLEKMLVKGVQLVFERLVNSFMQKWETTVVENHDSKLGPLPYVKRDNLQPGEVPADFIKMVLKEPFYKDKHARDMEHINDSKDIIQLENHLDTFTKGFDTNAVHEALLPAFTARKNGLAQEAAAKKRAIEEAIEASAKANAGS